MKPPSCYATAIRVALLCSATHPTHRVLDFMVHQ